eukprot:4742070-Prymnesium_polylepis.1
MVVNTKYDANATSAPAGATEEITRVGEDTIVVSAIGGCRPLCVAHSADLQPTAGHTDRNHAHPPCLPIMRVPRAQRHMHMHSDTCIPTPPG